MLVTIFGTNGDNPYGVSQGLLDWKFLNDRFQRGKKAVESYMDSKHKLVSHDTLVLGHSVIVQMQQSLGSSALLGQHFTRNDANKVTTVSNNR